MASRQAWRGDPEPVWALPDATVVVFGCQIAERLFTMDVGPKRCGQKEKVVCVPRLPASGAVAVVARGSCLLESTRC